MAKRPKCRHTDWVEFSSTPSWLQVSDPGRFDSLIQKLENPARQYPETVVCIGNGNKRELAGQIFPNRGSTRRTRSSLSSSESLAHSSTSSKGVCDIFLGELQEKAIHPTFYADFRLDGTITGREGSKCHKTESSCNTWPLTYAGVHDEVLTRLIFPFSNMVCIFAEDVGGMDAALDKIEAWSTTEHATDIARFAWQTLPRVCIITHGPSTLDTQIQDEASSMRVKKMKYRGHFSTVKIMRLDAEGAPNVEHDFRLLLKTELEASRNMKQEYRVQFNGNHLSSLFSQAMKNLVTADKREFSFIGATRLYRPVPSSYSEQFSTLLHIQQKYGVAFDAIATLIASCLLLDAYPRACHEFRACDLFDRLYADQLETAMKNGRAAAILPGEILCHDSVIARGRGAVFAKFAGWLQKKDQQETEIDKNKDWALQRHKKNLEKLRYYMDPKLLVSAEICVFCLTGPPQHVLKCGHALCDLCVPRLAQAGGREECCYVVTSCMICQASGNLKIYLKPATAGTRILTIDGGGVRGVGTLELLNMLQAELGDKARLQDFFDLAFGTSAGGLIVLGMFAKQWDVSECMTSFCEVAQRIFKPSNRLLKRILGVTYTLTCCLLWDNGLYESQPVISSFKESFGPALRMFSNPVNNVSRYKYAVTTTKIDDTAAVVFSNYNLVDQDILDLSTTAQSERSSASILPGRSAPTTCYRYSRNSISESPLVWEVARATSAAAPFFESAPIGNDGKHRDGGFRNPNATNVALENSRKIWPDTTIDITVSVGTGKKPQEPKASSVPLRGRLRNGTVAMLVRWGKARLLEAIDGEVIHEQVQNSLDDVGRSRYFRWNPEFPDGLPRLDDVRMMPYIREQFAASPSEKILSDIKMALVASSFFFELRSVPKYGRDRIYSCEGTIRIRGNPYLVLELLTSCAPERAVFVRRGELGQVRTVDAICPSCGLFGQDVQFEVHGYDDSHAISLKFGKGCEYRISGFPRDMAWFCKQQGLSDVFSAHPSSFDPCVCRLPRKLGKLDDRKRRARLSADLPDAKRRRVAPRSDKEPLYWF